MPLRQPPVSPLPADVDLHGRTVIVTGASAGIGLELSRQFLQRRVSTLILAVRNVSKGEATRAELLSESYIKRNNPNALVKVMEVDMASYDSVKSFAKQFKAEHRSLDILMLNAGISIFNRTMTRDGHETTTQVNYLSNALLLFELLPLLEASATETGRPSRVTVTGSRMYAVAHFPKVDVHREQSIVGYLDSPEGWKPYGRYSDTKMLVVLFLRELAARYDPDSVIVNQFCPGMVHTELTKELPAYLRIPVALFKALRARRLEVGGWVGLNAVAVAGRDSHGQLLGDMAIEPYVIWRL